MTTTTIDVELEQIVLFELPTRWFAERLLAHLGVHRLAWSLWGEAESVIGAVLKPERDDLAFLLRGVQEWMDRLNVAALRFEVDGRTYVLEPPPL